MKRLKINSTLILAAVVSAAAIVLVVAQLDLHELRHTISRTSLRWLAVAFVVYLFSYALRTLRLRQLLSRQEIEFAQLYSVTSLHGMFVYLMPARSGEVSLLALLKARLGVDLSDSMATLVVVRFFDFLSVALFLPLVLAAFWNRLPPAMSYSALAFLGLMALVAAAYFVWLRRWSLVSPVVMEGTRNRWRERVRRSLRQVMARLTILSRMPRQGRLLGLTVLIWLAVYTNLYLIAGSLGYWLEFGQVVVLSLLMIPLTLLPLQGVANLGSHEVGWVATFSLFDHPAVEAMTVAVGSHVVLLVFVLLLGATGWLVGALAGRDQRA